MPIQPDTTLGPYSVTAFARPSPRGGFAKKIGDSDDLCLWHLGQPSGRMRSSPRLGKAAWAKCIAHETRSSTETWRWKVLLQELEEKV